MDPLFPYIQRVMTEAGEAATDGSQVMAAAILYYIMDTFSSATSASPEAQQRLVQAAEIWVGTRGALMFPDKADKLLEEAKAFCLDYSQAEARKSESAPNDLEAMNIVWASVRRDKITNASELFQSVAAKNERFALQYNVVLVLMAKGQYSAKAFAKYLKRRQTVPDASQLDYVRALYREMYPRAPVAVITAAVDGLASEFATMDSEYKAKLSERADEQTAFTRRVREERIRDHLRMMAKKV
jgi:hypothetical protein